MNIKKLNQINARDDENKALPPSCRSEHTARLLRRIRSGPALTLSDYIRAEQLFGQWQPTQSKGVAQILGLRV